MVTISLYRGKWSIIPASPAFPKLLLSLTRVATAAFVAFADDDNKDTVNVANNDDNSPLYF